MIQKNDQLSTFFKPLPTEAKVIDLVDRILDTGNIRESAKCFCELILSVADPDAGDGSQYNLAVAAAKYAFTLTPDFEDAFCGFADLPPLGQISETTSYVSDFDDVEEVEKTQ